MITSLAWIPRGVAKRRPIRFELSPADVLRANQLQANESAETEEDNEGSEPDQVDESSHLYDGDELPAELRMEQYDEEDDLDGLLADDNDIEDDDAVDTNLMDTAMNGDDDDEDNNDDEILPDDSLIALALTEEECSRLEVQVLTSEGTLYTHHDILLPDFPLCLAWLDCPPFVASDGNQNSVGNFMAIGTFSPAIEIWNLDVMDAIEPVAVLGGKKEVQQKPGKNKKSKERFVPGSHEDSVLSLSWNANFRQALASGSADTSVKVWDVTSQQCSHTFRHHTDKVQSVLWHPRDSWLLASGAFDKTVHVTDCRTAVTSKLCAANADVECLAWDPFNSFNLLCSLENGEIVCMDIRNISSKSSTSVYHVFQAHNKAVSSIQFSTKVEGLVATASVDKTVKVWDVVNLPQSRSDPVCVAYKTMNVGKLLTMQFSQDDPFLMATAGDKGLVAVWESDENDAIRNHFEARVKTSA